MEWSVVKIENNTKGRNIPYASIGYGRISLSAAACRLINNYEKYEYVELLQGKRNGKACVGVRFLTEQTINSLHVSRRTQTNKSGQKIDGIDISNKGTLEKLFGPAGSGTKAERYNVEKDNECENILIIYKE